MNAFTTDCPKLLFGIIARFLFKLFKLSDAVMFSLYMQRIVMHFYKLQVKERFRNLVWLLKYNGVRLTD